MKVGSDENSGRMLRKYGIFVILALSLAHYTS